MDGKLALFIAKLKDFLKKSSLKTKKLLAIDFILLLVFASIMTYFLYSQSYDVIFSDLNEQEASEIMGKLQQSGVDYQYETGGTLLVPKAQKAKVKAQLTYEGYPESGFTYNIFKENRGRVITESERESYKLLDLQERLAAAIALFDGVQDAKVTIVLGEDSNDASESQNATKSTASVAVTMKDGGSLTEQQVEGIQRLVSKSTPHLAFGNVIVTDGNEYDVSMLMK